MDDKTGLNITLEPSQPTSVLLPPPKDAISFMTKSSDINLNISKHNKKISLRFKNKWSYPVHNLNFTMDGTLGSILSFHDSVIRVIDPDEVMEQVISIKPPIEGNKFAGTITASSDEGTKTEIEVVLHYDEEKSDTDESKIILEEIPPKNMMEVPPAGNQTSYQPQKPRKQVFWQ